MTYETILFEAKGPVGVITLNRPEQMNGLNGQMFRDLSDCLDQCERDDSVRALVLTGSGRAFCSGADVKYVNTLKTTADFIVFSRHTRDAFHKIEVFGKPVIAAISGLALGGGLELALCCDLRIAAENVKLGLPECRLGAMPGAGGTQRLPRLIGPALAKQLIFTGNHITAAEAYRIGLVNEVVAVESCLDRAVEMATEIAERAPLALRMAKSAINTAMQVDLESGLNYESQCTVYLSGTEDQTEGFRSFVEKRKPVWKGR